MLCFMCVYIADRVPNDIVFVCKSQEWSLIRSFVMYITEIVPNNIVFVCKSHKGFLIVSFLCV
jgi:hypothetical protein